MRFSPANDSADSLIAGMVFGAMSGYFSKSSPLPLSLLPREIRDKEANLHYQPITALEGANFKVLLGKRVAAVSFPKPYPGWGKVRPLVIECFNAVLKTKLVKAVERVSIKYTNLLAQGRDENDLSQLNAKVELGEFDVSGPGLEAKAEIRRNDCITIVQFTVGTKINVTTPNQSYEGRGVMLNVDTIKMGPFSDIEQVLPSILDDVHTTEKETFFGLLKDETLEKLGPVWD